MKALNRILLLPILSLIFIFSACFKKTGGQNNSISTDSSNIKKDKVIQSPDSSSITSVLTEEIIDKTSDRDLLQIVSDNLFKKLPKDYSKEYNKVITFNKSQQAIFVIWELETEVNNGGFNQYYFNSSGQYAKLTPNALQLVGAKQFADLMSRANEIYQKNYDKIIKDQDGTLDGFSKSYKGNPLNKLDEEFYKLYNNEKLESIQISYIRKNKDQFIDK